MRIAQIAPLIESVPPRLYGGTERIVSYLTEELVGMGHEVTLFASNDSHTSAHLVAGARSHGQPRIIADGKEESAGPAEVRSGRAGFPWRRAQKPHRSS